MNKNETIKNIMKQFNVSKSEAMELINSWEHEYELQYNQEDEMQYIKSDK